jgi:tetratricopeptide (TPR) repeat protein
MSGFIAALFALHPLHVESVAWVAERKDVLSTFFWMLTMWAYVHYVERPRLNRYLLVLLCFTLGLSSKPMLVTLPFVLLLLDYWPLGRFQFGQLSGNSKLSTSKLISSSDRRSVALRLVWEKAPFFLLSALSSILAIIAAERVGAAAPLETYRLGMRFANALVSYVSYIEKMIWPSHLAVFYPYPEAFPIWKVVGAGLLLGCLTVLAIRAARKRPYLVVGWLWYLGTLVPVIGLIQAGSQAMADRFTYVPLIGLFIMIVWGVQDILAGWRYRRVALSILAGVILLILMMVTRFQVKHWQNDVTLFTHTLDVTVNNALSRNNLGAALFRQGKYQEAIVHYTEALRIDPRNALARNGLGVALARQGRYQESVDHWKEVLRIKPDFADAHNNLGNTLVNLGKYQEAIAHYNEALRIKPDNANAHNNLGGALRRLGRHEEAIVHFTEALKIKPDYAEAHGNLGNIFTELGRVEEAIAQYNEALRIKSDFAEVRLSLGLAYLRVGNRDSAMKEYEILKRINPDLADALYSEIYK